MAPHILTPYLSVLLILVLIIKSIVTKFSLLVYDQNCKNSIAGFINWLMCYKILSKLQLKIPEDIIIRTQVSYHQFSVNFE